jgi:flagellin-like protein
MSLNTPKSLLIQGEKMRKIMDNKAVSPVVGTILLIAITVALAAIVATLVSGLGGRGAPPSVMLTVTAKENALDNYVILTVSHNGGDDLTLTDLKVEGSSIDNIMTQVTSFTNVVSGATTLTVGGTAVGSYYFGGNPTNAVITVYVIHNPSKQKLFSSASITVQP